jgi:hypothetical protein
MMGWYGVVPYALQLLYFFQNRERDIVCWDFSQKRAGSATLARALKKIE